MISWTRGKKLCAWCGKEFIQKSPNHVFCSKACRNKGQIQKQRLARERDQFSPNMRKIMEMVKDDPNYARVVQRMEGKDETD